MSKEEIIKVFVFLEKEMNKNDLFYFEYDSSNITAYFKSDHKAFAQFYPKKILQLIEELGWNNE